MRRADGRLRIAGVLVLLGAVAAMAAAFAQDPRWAAMTPTAQAEWQQRRAAWDALPAHEREDRRARYAAWRALDEVQRARLRTAAAEVAALPPEHQTALRTQFAMLDAMQRHGWRLGPELGADWPRLQPLFAYVPPGERAGALALLRQLDAGQRDDLAALAQRLPPQDRDAFRRQLLAVPVGQRGAWLKQQRER